VREINFIVKEEKGRIDKILAENFSFTRSKIQDWLKMGAILVNGKNGKANYQVKKSDEITIHVPEIVLVSAEPENIPLDIIYEDQDVLVVNKPQGMVVHPSVGHRGGTLVNALLYHGRDLAEDINTDFFRPGIVHRIDKDTSGLLMIAKNDEAREKLSLQLKNHTALRRYLALVHGDLPHTRGEINAPIGRSKKDRQRQAVMSGGREAITYFEVLERFGDYSLLKLKLKTGRTHQIRVHFAYIKHPLACDPIYGFRKTLPGNGQFLHAGVLGFNHPRTEKFLTFEAPPPKFFEETLKNLRSRVKS